MARTKGKERKRHPHKETAQKKNSEKPQPSLGNQVISEEQQVEKEGDNEGDESTGASFDLSGPYKYRPMRPSDPPFCATDPLTGEQQGLFVWSYVAPGASRQKSEKVGLVVHGCFVSDGKEVDEFIAKLHAAWPDFDIYKTSTGRWVNCPLPAHIDRLIPKKYDNAELQKIMEQHRQSEEAIRKANVKRMKEVKQLQKRQVMAQKQRAKLHNAEPRKILTDEEVKKIDELVVHANPFDNYRITSSDIDDQINKNTHANDVSQENIQEIPNLPREPSRMTVAAASIARKMGSPSGSQLFLPLPPLNFNTKLTIPFGTSTTTTTTTTTTSTYTPGRKRKQRTSTPQVRPPTRRPRKASKLDAAVVGASSNSLLNTTASVDIPPVQSIASLLSQSLSSPYNTQQDADNESSASIPALKNQQQLQTNCTNECINFESLAYSVPNIPSNILQPIDGEEDDETALKGKSSANNNNNNNKYVVRMDTTQLSKLRSAFDAIKDIIHEINLKFFPQDHPDHGLRMMAMDNAHVALVDMVCPAHEIQEAGAFYCKRPVLAGISVSKFYKIIKTLKNHDSLTLYIKDNTDGVFEICTYTPKTNTKQKFKIILLDLNDSEFTIPPESFDTVRHINAEQFQTIVHNLIQAVDPDTIGIHYVRNKLKLTGEGDYAKAKTSLEELEVNLHTYGSSNDATGNNSSKVSAHPDPNPNPNHNPSSSSTSDTFLSPNLVALPPPPNPLPTPNPASRKTHPEIHNYYPVRYISTAIKPYQVCEDLCLYIKHDWPLIIEYPLAGLGTLRFCIAQKENMQSYDAYGGNASYYNDAQALKGDVSRESLITSTTPPNGILPVPPLLTLTNHPNAAASDMTKSTSPLLDKMLFAADDIVFDTTDEPIFYSSPPLSPINQGEIDFEDQDENVY